jgi:hypothetical protein
MPDFNVDDRVHVIKRAGRKRQAGTIKRIVPNLTEEDRFQAYVVVFETNAGAILEHYLQYELQHSTAETDVSPR